MPAKPPKSDRAAEIGERIALARKEADGMTQRELADLLGVTERSVAAYEAGDVIPYRFMMQLEELLNRPRSWFLYGDAAPAGDTGELRQEIAELKQQLTEIQQFLEAHLPQKRTRR